MNQSKSNSEILIQQENVLINPINNSIGKESLELNKSEVIDDCILQSKRKGGNNSEAIKTFCRIRPIDTKNDIFKIKENSDDKTLLVNSDPTFLKKLNTVPIFTFSKVFDENSTQVEVFERTCQNLVEDLIKKRKSGLIFTYGMTNAGKTFTVVGSPTSPGILPQSLKFLYDKVDNNVDGEGEFSVYCNFVEIYNEEVFDLLANSTDPKNKYYKKKITIKENIKKLFFLHDVTYQKISNLEDFNNSLSKGISKKVHAATSLNQNSSRSHTIFKIIIKPNCPDEEEVSLSIVDLAGSERANRTEAQGKELQEACKINQSLSVLGKCMEALRYNSIYTSKRLVPFRESKLTMLFQEYFQGDQNVIMITNINPKRDDFEETLRALNYSCIAKEIKPIKSKIVVNPIRKQVKIINQANNINETSLFKENEISVPEKENLNNELGYISKPNSIRRGSVNEVNQLKLELQKLKEEFLEFKSGNISSEETRTNYNEETVKKQTNPLNAFSKDLLTNPPYPLRNDLLNIPNPFLQNPIMQIMNNVQSHLLNDNQNPLLFPNYFPFIWPGIPLNNQSFNQKVDTNISNINNNISDQNSDFDFFPPNVNSFNLVFINSKFNDFHMGPKKKINKNSRKNKKESSMNYLEENKSLKEVKEVPENIPLIDEVEDIEIIKSTSPLTIKENSLDIIEDNTIDKNINEGFLEKNLKIGDTSFKGDVNILEEVQEIPVTEISEEKDKKIKKKKKVNRKKREKNGQNQKEDNDNLENETKSNHDENVKKKKKKKKKSTKNVEIVKKPENNDPVILDETSKLIILEDSFNPEIKENM
jgi:hypothetical protein